MSSVPASPPLSGLYVIVDPAVIQGCSLVEACTEAVAGGARLFQYRDKAASGREAYHRASRLRQLTADAGAIFVVNDRCDLALAVEADGVHLGQNDLPLALARAVMGKKLIGISTHNDRQVTEATAAGADYLGFGPIFATDTKSDHEPVVGPEALRRIRSLTSLPIFAIGGMTLETVPAMVEAGADGVAVISAIWRSSDIAQTVRQFMARLKEAAPPTRR
jgi:thiamine-phosphate pyrophosphorylase